MTVNKRLIELGLQTKHRNRNKQIYYELTTEGLKYGQYQDSSIRKNTLTRSIKWYENVLDLLKPASLF